MATAQIQIYDGVSVTHVLPYPQSYVETQVIRSADFTSYTGFVSRDFRESIGKYPRLAFIEWEELTTAEMIDINDAYMAMAADMSTSWEFTSPDNLPYDAYLNPEQFNLQSQRYAGVNGEVLYTARMSLIIE